MTRAASSSTQAACFAWCAESHDGALQHGALWAGDKAAVRDWLQARGVTPLSIRAQRWRASSRVRPVDMAGFWQGFAALYGSGVPLLRVLTILAQQAKHDVLRSALRVSADDIGRGIGLHQAFARHAHLFDHVTVAWLQVGEHTGKLAQVAQHLAEFAQQRDSTRRQIINALWYPAFVLTVAVLLSMAVLVWIVPVFAQIYQQAGQSLPWLTQRVVDVSAWLRELAWLGVLLGLVATGVWRHSASHKWRERMRGVPYRLPVVGALAQDAAQLMWVSQLGLMYQSGVMLDEALGLCALAQDHPALRAASLRLQAQVRMGASLSQSMRQMTLFDAALLERVQIGEETGRLDLMLEQHRQQQAAQLRDAIARMTTLFEPLMLLIVGALVAGLVIALYLPILGLGGAVR